MHSGLGTDIAALFETHESDRFSLHKRRLNEQMVRVLKTIGYDVGFCKGRGASISTTARTSGISIC